MAETAGESGYINPSFNELFNSSVIGRKVEKLTDPQLWWAKDKMMTSFEGVTEHVIEGPMFRTDSSGNQTSPGRNEYKGKLAQRVEGTAYPRIKTQYYDINEYGMSKFGFAIEFGEKDRQDTKMNRRKYNDTMRDASRFSQEFISYEVLNATLNDFSFTSGTGLSGYVDNELAGSEFGYDSSLGFVCGTLDEDYYWDSPETAEYLKDTRQFQTLGKNISGYNVNYDTLFIHNTLFEKVEQWADTNSRTWETSPLPGGRKMGTMSGMRFVSVNDVDGWSGNESYILLKDSSVIPATTYYWTKNISTDHTKWSEDAKFQVREAKSNDDYNALKYYMDIEFRTVLFEPKYYALVKVAA